MTGVEMPAAKFPALLGPPNPVLADIPFPYAESRGMDRQIHSGLGVTQPGFRVRTLSHQKQNHEARAQRAHRHQIENMPAVVQNEPGQGRIGPEGVGQTACAEGDGHHHTPQEHTSQPRRWLWQLYHPALCSHGDTPHTFWE
jgi:hypothetical protein